MVGTRRNNASGAGDPDLRNVIASEVGEVLQEVLPGMFEQMMTEILGVIDKKFAEMQQGQTGSSRSQGRVSTYREFSACQPPFFEGKKDPLVSTRWLSEVEGAFRTSFCTPEVKVLYATNLLRGSAQDWWDLYVKFHTEAEIAAMTWEEFKIMFKEKYVTQFEIERVTKEFLSLVQTTESVHEITDKFMEKSLFCPEYVATEKMKMNRYKDMLRADIREFVVTARCETLKDMVDVALVRELELETQDKMKRKAPASEDASTQGKKSKTSGFKNEERKEHPKCKECGKSHLGECRFGLWVCYRCGKPGHMSKDCKETAKMCFGCHQFGHIKSECPNLTGGSVQAPATATLRITDGKEGKGRR